MTDEPTSSPAYIRGGSQSPPPLKIIARACQFCRARKTRCDTRRPHCGTCVAHNRQCVYALEPPKRRPSTTLVNKLREEKKELEHYIIALKFASPEERANLLDNIIVSEGQIRLPATVGPSDMGQDEAVSVSQVGRQQGNAPDPEMTDEDYDPTSFLSLDERGRIGVYGPTSALHSSSPTKDPASLGKAVAGELRNELIANAALQRQKEHALVHQQTIGGEPAELALHLLDLHWNRQHHTFLLTYRPAIMRDLVNGGPCCSDFLLNAIFACVSKFSDRIEVRDNKAEAETAGRRFFQRCEKMLSKVLSVSKIPTIIGLLLLGSTFNARGLASKGWLYTGYALRMVYDLGLHLDCKQVGKSAEDVEIRRRVFWGAFICDKLQSLYLGRPFAMQLRDAHVSLDFLDTLEENELWTPYIDTIVSSTPLIPIATPIHSVSTFQKFCLLSKIMANIVDRFYVLGASARNTTSHLGTVDKALMSWYEELPTHLRFEPWTRPVAWPSIVPPNIIIVLTTFNALLILLHRPFVFDGHLRGADAPELSRNRCTSAAHNITSLAAAYQGMYSLRRAPYLLSYAVYVACTIHARNSSSETTRRQEDVTALITSLKCLDELTVPNSGVSNPAGIIRRLMAANGIPSTSESIWNGHTPDQQELDSLCRLFPSSTPDLSDLSNADGLSNVGPFGFDSLHSFMDAYMLPLDDVILNSNSMPEALEQSY